LVNPPLARLSQISERKIVFLRKERSRDLQVGHTSGT
jgi:hypothetical protein